MLDNRARPRNMATDRGGKEEEEEEEKKIENFRNVRVIPRRRFSIVTTVLKSEWKRVVPLRANERASYALYST